jgi:glycosyltransferase involved in cell wall biosynthesis
MILSLIIPVYNVEKFIYSTLKSVFYNIKDDIEVIIIDDGSVDKSLCKIKKITENLESNIFITLISQKNMGISYTRNKGISIAKGEYISFLDSDDILSEEYFKKIIPILKEHSPDIIQFDFNLFKKSAKEKINSGLRMKSFGLKESSKHILLEVFNYNSWYPWSRIYKRKLFNNIEFPLGYNFEDPAIIPFIFLKAKKVYFLNKPLYYYRINDSSITRSKSIESLSRNVISLEYLLDNYIKNYNNNFLFSICFLHFFRIYLDYCYKSGGFNYLKKGWDKYSYFMDICYNNKELLDNKAGSIFLKIRFLGSWSYFIMRMLTFLNDLKNGK